MEKNFGTWNRNQNLGKMVWFRNTAFAFGYIDTDPSFSSDLYNAIKLILHIWLDLMKT